MGISTLKRSTLMTTLSNEEPHHKRNLKSDASRSIEQQVAKCIDVTTRIKNIVRVWLSENKKLLGHINAHVRLLNDVGTMELEFSGGNLTEDHKEIIKKYLLNGDFKTAIQLVLESELGWSNFRVSRCSWGKFELKYSWCIQKIDPLKKS